DPVELADYRLDADTVHSGLVELEHDAAQRRHPRQVRLGEAPDVDRRQVRVGGGVEARELRAAAPVEGDHTGQTNLVEVGVRVDPVVAHVGVQVVQVEQNARPGAAAQLVQDPRFGVLAVGHGGEHGRVLHQQAHAEPVLHPRDLPHEDLE